MFLFLSKLLPLFVYPLGLACLLLVISLFLWWRSPRLVPLPIALALLILLLGSNAWVSNALLRSLEWRHLPPELPSAEAIVILGGATSSAVPPRPTIEIQECDRKLH